ncbi:ABC transporter permease [Reichenbachiella agarivorans]|uniref:ABC transporter permease n=1 Tax=Reichenbachiella agarivorans TaxID=2979464 RepID=A0ABY6CPF0_9BACT|nr:ABC transporter permease [Reichenbachiella agarivorans]UXP32411.1 ABC transporter permease [Reichenbachiella agarivorans]
MFSRDRWQEIFQTISKNKLRTFLSGFTVALGIFIFVILFGLGNGLKNTFESFFLNDATNLIWVFPGRTSMPYKGYKSNRQIEFKNDDLEDIKHNFSIYIDYVSPAIYRNQKIKYANEYNNYNVQAVGPGFQFAEKTYLMAGRFINDDDTKHKNKYTVIGRLVRDDLFGKTDPLGEFVDIGGSMFKVIGVFQDDGGDNEERRVYIPYTTKQLQEKNTDKIDQVVIGFKPEIGYFGAIMFEEKLRQFLKDKHQIDPNDQRGIFIRNVADDLRQNQQFASVLQIIVTFVGLGTLMAGIIGISNIMVFVVKERTKELGIRKALGATPRSVIAMILQESIFITTIAGYIGLFAGILILNSLGVKLEHYFIKNPYIDMQTGVFATVVLIIFGAIAGYIPARRAAKIKPIVALRDE